MVNTAAAVCLGLAASAATANAAYCSGMPPSGEHTNDYATTTDAPVKVASHPNGALYTAGPAMRPFPVIKVWGNATERGTAYGTLLKDDVHSMMTESWQYFIDSIDSGMTQLPPAAAQKVAELGLAGALDLTARLTDSFVDPTYHAELDAMAAASGVDPKLVRRLHVLPELTKGSCSMLGAWDSAVADPDGLPLQVRALDWDVDGPFKDYPLVSIFEPTDGGHSFANIGIAGLMLAITGYSEKQIAISEIGVGFPDDSFGQGTPDTPPEIVQGEPFGWVLRDVLQKATSKENALDTVCNHTNRTCNLIVAIGDGAMTTDAVSGLEYGGRVCTPYGDQDLLPVNATWHPVIDDVVYNGMDWLCPNYTEKLAEAIQEFHGKLTVDVLTTNVMPTTGTGNLHVAVYDLSKSLVDVAFHARSDEDPANPEMAYSSPYTRLDLSQLW